MNCSTLNVISAALRVMPEAQILGIRAEIARELSVEIPIVDSTLNMIDGHLALREIAKMDG